MPDWPVIVTAMSFNLTVTVREGKPSVTASGDVPEGEFIIHGHDDSQHRQFGVTHRGPDGRYVAAANSDHYKEV